MTQLRTVSYLHKGKPQKVAVEVPIDAESNHEEETGKFVQTLEDNHQIAYEPGPLQPGKTHQVIVDDKGNKVLVRKRFSAI
jgi:hypothetical protein